MSKYTLNITKQVPNPNYDPGARYERESPAIDVQTLSTEITEFQFKKVQEAVLKTFGDQFPKHASEVDKGNEG